MIYFIAGFTEFYKFDVELQEITLEELRTEANNVLQELGFDHTTRSDIMKQLDAKYLG